MTKLTLQGSGSGKAWVYVGLAVALVVLIVWSWPEGDSLDSEVRYVPVSGFADVHGLALDPEDPSILYIATHHGLLRLSDDTELVRIGDLQHDYMGFSAHPQDSGVFWVSGHPSGGGNMGVRKSTDGGFTWEQLALDGVDFHAMAVSPADPERLWGYFRGDVYATQDGGHTWSTIGAPPAPVYAFAPDPTDAETVYAATQTGIFVSPDGGVTWSMRTDAPSTVLAIHPATPSTWYRAGPAGLARSDDGGDTWQDVVFEGSGTIGYLALHPQDPDVVYMATYQAGLWKSTDGGRTWDTLRTPSR